MAQKYYGTTIRKDTYLKLKAFSLIKGGTVKELASDIIDLYLEEYDAVLESLVLQIEKAEKKINKMNSDEKPNKKKGEKQEEIAIAIENTKEPSKIEENEESVKEEKKVELKEEKIEQEEEKKVELKEEKTEQEEDEKVELKKEKTELKKEKVKPQREQVEPKKEQVEREEEKEEGNGEDLSDLFD